MVRAMCGRQLIDRKRDKDLMLGLGLSEAIDNQLAMANSGRVLRMKDAHILRLALEFEINGRRQKRCKHGHCRNRLNVKE